MSPCHCQHNRLQQSFFTSGHCNLRVHSVRRQQMDGNDTRVLEVASFTNSWSRRIIFRFDRGSARRSRSIHIPGKRKHSVAGGVRVNVGACWRRHNSARTLSPALIKLFDRVVTTSSKGPVRLWCRFTLRWDPARSNASGYLWRIPPEMRHPWKTFHSARSPFSNGWLMSRRRKV